jgi:hypothetical protein
LSQESLGVAHRLCFVENHGELRFAFGTAVNWRKSLDL